MVREPASGGSDADVLIVGTGTMGAMVAWRLAQRGVSVIALDRFAPGHDLGAAGGETRLFRTAYHEGTEYVPFLLEAQRLWRELEAATGVALLEMTGGLMVAPPDHPGIRTALRGLAEHGLEHTVHRAGELRERYPQIVFDDDEVGVVDPGTGALRSNLAVLTAAAQAERLGAVVRHYEPVTAISSDRAGVSVVTAAGQYRARRAVVTTGPWVQQLLPDLRGRVATRRIATTWYQPVDRSAFGPGAFPVLWRRGWAETSVIPAIDSAVVKVNGPATTAPIVHRDADMIDLRLHVSDFWSLREMVRRSMPGLHPDPVRYGIYKEGYTADRRALVGQVPGQPNVHVLAGFSGHGFKLAPFFGELAADMLTAGDRGSDAAFFALDRAAISA